MCNASFSPSAEVSSVAREPRLASESIAGQRPYQEDAILVKSLRDGRVLVAVADGMGGHAAGEVASALALETLESALEEGQGIDGAFALANRRVHDMAHDPGKTGMGTTLVAALVEDGEFMIANVGDSRGYLLTASEIRQVTEDHSFVSEAMKRGQSEEEAMATPWKDALTRCIGTDPDVEVDVFGPFPVEPNIALIVCSDGLYKTLDGAELRRLFVGSGTPESAAKTMVATALARGSDDNISVAIAEYGEVPRLSDRATMPMDFPPGAGPGDPEPVADGAELPLDDGARVESVMGEGAPGAPGSDDPASVRHEHPNDGRRGPPVGLIVTAVVVLVTLAVVLAF